MARLRVGATSTIGAIQLSTKLYELQSQMLYVRAPAVAARTPRR